MKRFSSFSALCFGVSFALAGCAASEPSETEPAESQNAESTTSETTKVPTAPTTTASLIDPTAPAAKRLDDLDFGCRTCGPLPDPWKPLSGPLPDPWTGADSHK